ncbi:hypothetical protein C479_02356 [Halovivax asiaticus JCM 14624]|uniref:Helix-hairpin-helix domain-containing protein n=1 Tax=Halovivax asiaticus JCM 14624 TaxID=1227490 RepID=M0BRU0_9EURY|nr:hypothetical protein C479_02356 [Halovivax asiaticus JCM 14624]
MASDNDVIETPSVRPLEADERSRLEGAGVEPADLESVGIDPAGVAEKEYSYRQLLDGGLEESAAEALRRTFSLPWSYQTEGDLDDRSEAVSGLGDAERAWIAASADEDWQGFEHAGERSIPTTTETPDERPYPRPTPVTAVTGVGGSNADQLAEAGIRSAERLATIHAGEVASVLDLDVLHVRTWRHNARELLRE